jgi:aminopeptidase N
MRKIWEGNTGKRFILWKGFLLIFLLMLPHVTCAVENPVESVLDYTLEVSFDIQASVIKGTAMIPVKKGQEVKLEKGRLHLVQVTLDKEEIGISSGDETLRILPSQEGTLVIRYEGIFREPPSGIDRKKPPTVISEKGIFLTGTWYPKPDQMCQYHLTAILPVGYEGVSEAEKIEKTAKENRTVFAFSFPHPIDAITLMATDRYRIVQDHFDGVEISAYFFPEDADLIKTYLEQAKHYLELYGSLISNFPYRRFSIVENFLPTGFSMPTYTVLGQQVVRLPFIPETSLGHEILHQWFGNLVYIDYRKGNWAEGLTTFLADHLFEEEKGRGFEYRKGVLIRYMSYVNDKNEIPLRDFKERTDYASEAIGYGKALMVFQMLRNLVGRERFYESIRYFTAEMRFQKASWGDIRRAFERYYHKDLDWFFHQWIDEKGLPELYLEEVEVKPSGARFKVAFTVRQKNRVYRLDVPILTFSYGGKTKKFFHLRGERERLEMILEDMPERMAIDEDYDIARMLSISEFPPVVARLIGDEERIVVLPPSGTEIYEEIIDTFQRKGGRISKPDSVNSLDRSHSLVILGADNPVLGRLYGGLVTQGGFSVVIEENPWNPWKVAGIFNARSKGEVEDAFPKIFHYGRYSVLSFDHGMNTSKKTEGTPRGITQELYKEAVAVDIPTLKTLPGVMERVADKKIIYVGETHEEFSHHVMQLEIIKNLHRRGRSLAIGMEMFQKPFQRAVDEYIQGKIDEREFLKGTQYFKRWGFDYHLYQPILLFARSEKIPIVALNQRGEIVDKVFRGGLDSLSAQEKEFLPSQMDFSDGVYRERLRKTFQEHEDYKLKNFDFFYQAQIVWDETMSESVDQFLRTHPGDQMVILAGSGHLAYGSGIPKRTARRNGYDYAIILNDVDLENGIADYVLFPGTIPGQTSPRLMVFLKEEAGKVEIAGFPQNSVSEKAGIRVGDLLLMIDRTPVHSIDDVKIELLRLKKGEKAKVKIFRKSFLGVNQEMDFEVALQ